MARRKTTRCSGEVRTLIRSGSDVGGGAAEAEDEARPGAAGDRAARQVEAGEVEVDYALAGKQLGQGLPAPKGVERSSVELGGHDGDRLGPPAARHAGATATQPDQREDGGAPTGPQEPSGHPSRASVHLPRMKVGISISGTSAGGPAAGGACGARGWGRRDRLGRGRRPGGCGTGAEGRPARWSGS